MATVQIRNLDEGAYQVLKERAAGSGRSLQEYLRLLLEEQASRPTVTEALARLRSDLTWTDSDVRPTAEEIVEAVRAGRDS